MKTYLKALSTIKSCLIDLLVKKQNLWKTEIQFHEVGPLEFSKIVVLLMLIERNLVKTRMLQTWQINMPVSKNRVSGGAVTFVAREE